MNKDKISVVFRIYPIQNEVIALFPYEKWNDKGDIASYMHMGQHGAAYYHGVIDTTKPATEPEYRELKKELESLGYNLKVIKKRGAK